MAKEEKVEFFRCDSCQKMFPMSARRKSKASYNFIDAQSKRQLQEYAFFVQLCPKCANPTVNTEGKK